MTPNQDKALEMIADLWRGDWSGSTFDGRDGARWIHTVRKGDEDEIAGLISELEFVNERY